MKEEIIGRENEIQILEECRHSHKAELVAVYGRRRIGKTFLVKQVFRNRFDFFVTGLYGGSISDELDAWHRKMNEYSSFPYPAPKTWNEAFEQLKHYILSLRKERVIIFIDEMPWLDTPRSKFVRAFEQFWNDWASSQSKVMMIICGSATTWMNDKVISQKGGLHNRVTRKIRLTQFSLHEARLLLESRGISWNDHQTAECYMILGGTPYYLNLLHKGKSLAWNIDYLFFRRGAELADEYNVLLRPLFKDANIYRKIIELLARTSMGMTRDEIATKLKVASGGSITEALANLRNCDFVRTYSAIGKKKRDTMYQLCDMFILFHLRFVHDNDGADEAFWSNSIDNPSKRSWTGYAFEQLCFNHIPQIKQCLGIRGVLSNVCSWIRKADKEQGIKGRQIDMLIERRDQIINVCEAKFSTGPYVITDSYLKEMFERMEDFRSSTKTSYALHPTMIASAGLAANANAQAIESVVTLEDLFKTV